MKIRSGFVSNSSSSSYTCLVCGSTESGYDVSLSDLEMFECENEHLVCQSHAVGEGIKKTKWGTNLRSVIKEGATDLWSVPAKYCPICQLEAVSEADLLAYCLKKLYRNRKDMTDEIRRNYNSYEQFRKDIQDATAKD